jgi:hypothetical protein
MINNICLTRQNSSERVIRYWLRGKRSPHVIEMLHVPGLREQFADLLAPIQLMDFYIFIFLYLASFILNMLCASRVGR